MMDVFVAGTNGAVYEKVFTDKWYGWFSLGGQLAPNTGPGASAWPGQGMNCFVEGTNGALYQNTYTWSGWSGWANLGGQLSASPTAATFTGAGTINMPVFVRGTNGFIYYKESYGGSWHNWSTGITGPP